VTTTNWSIHEGGIATVLIALIETDGSTFQLSRRHSGAAQGGLSNAVI
jgi:hypothetical protein